MKDVEACRSFLSQFVAIPDTRLGKAIRYFQKRSVSFFMFLEDPFLDPTNNEVEQTAKAFATARKNFLFAKSENGGETAGILTTIVKTAVANDLYPDEYIIRILKNRNELISNTEKFLPWNPWMREGIDIKNEVPFTRTKICLSG